MERSSWHLEPYLWEQEELHDEAIVFFFLYRGGQVTRKDHPERVQKEKERGNGRGQDGLAFKRPFQMGHFGAVFL